MSNLDYEFKDIISDNPELPPFRDLYPYIITQSQLSKEDIPKRNFILAEWMPEDSFGMVYADRGVGKSWFCMAMGVAIAKGDQTFLGWEIHGQHSVLYVDGEMAKVELKERFDQLTEYNLSNLFILSSETLYRDGKPICIDERDEQEAINNALEQLEKKNSRPQIIILDNLSTLRRDVNENDNNDVQNLLDWLIKLRHKQYTVILVHHTGKSGQQRGASKIEVPLDYMIKLETPKNQKYLSHEGASFDFEFKKVRTKAPNPSQGTLSLRQDSDGVLKLVSGDISFMPDRKFLMLKYIKVYEGRAKVTIRDLASKFNVAVGTAQADRKELMKDNYLDNKYSVTREGDQILFEIWPNKFKEPMELDLVQEDDSPF